jgi:hypothetical protein
MDQFSSLQASDGHWPGDFSGIMFVMPGLVRVISAQNAITSFFFPCLAEYFDSFLCTYMDITYLHLHLQIFALYVTRSLNVVISPEHRREICRYIYNHQACHSSLGLSLSLRPCWGQGQFAPDCSLWMYIRSLVKNFLTHQINNV